MSHPAYWIALQAALGVHSKKIAGLMDFFGDAEGVFAASPQEIKQCPVLNEKETAAILARPFHKSKAIWEECVKSDITPIGPDHPRYPDTLRNLPDMPAVLYIKGTLPHFDRNPAISVVGTRKPTPYGQTVCERIASVLAVAGMTVVSGGALGLDSVAHRAALEVDGITVAVLGCGINAGYLKSNQPLREDICKKGALISEYPPSMSATRYSFPARNRLIAALSLGTIVVEAGEKSGTLITAACALEQGKDVFAVPGSVMSQSFTGSNRMISQGAVPIFGGLDVLERYEQEYFHVLDMHKARELHQKHLQDMIMVVDASHPPQRKQVFPPVKEEEIPLPNVKNPPKGLSETATLVYNILSAEKSMPLHWLVEKTGTTVPSLLRELTRMEVQGLVSKDTAGNYQLEQ